MPPDRTSARDESMPAEYVLAIDLGTSGPKVGLVSTRGDLRGGEFEPVRLRLQPNGGAEQDPEEWWTAIVAAARRLLETTAVPRSRIVAISVTAQWSGTVPVDAGGDPVGDAIIWMDARGAPYVERLIGGPVKIEGYDVRKLRTWIRLTGGAPSRSGKDPLAHILYLRHEDPERYQSAAMFLEPKDYLNLRLTGRAVATFDSIALHWLTDNRDPDRVAYSPELASLADIDTSRLPPLIRAVDLVGPVRVPAAEALGLNPGTPVIAGTPDLQSALIGAGTVADFSAHLYIGTSSWLTCHVPFKKTDLLHNIASLPAPLPGRYFVADEQETAGAALDFAAAALLGRAEVPPAERGELYRELDETVAGAPPGAGRVLFTPWLYGERTPVEDAFIRSGFFNQSLNTSRPHLVRAVFEGVAYNARWLLTYVERFTRTRLDPIVIAGGGANSDVWCQIFADVLGRTVRRVSDPIWVNVRGAGLLASAALGSIRFGEIPGLVPIDATFLPDRNHAALYDELFGEFRNLYKATRRIYRRLNRPRPSP